MTSEYRTVASQAARLCTQAFGDSSDPPILLVMGATASMMWWPDALCERLAAAGRYVIRFDHRDTGESTTGAVGEASYDVPDLAGDVLAILDAYGITKGHLVGMSLGAYVSEYVAVRNTDRVETLSLIAAEPLGGEPVPAPEMSAEFLRHFGSMEAIDWKDRQQMRKFLEEVARLSSSPTRGYDRKSTADRIEREMDRSGNLRAAFNHAAIAGHVGGADLRDIKAPTLVIQGEHDPIVPVANARAIARQVKGAKLHILPKAGHELHGDDLEEIAERLIEHTGRG